MSGPAVSRAGIFQRLSRFHIGPRSLRSQGISLQGARPVYDNGSRRWWDRAIYAFVMMDLVITASFCELTWNHWTVRADPPQPSSTSAQGETQTTASPTPHYVLRPTWQRASLVGYTLLGGIGLAFLLYSRRASAIRRLYIIPDPASKSPSSTKHSIANRLVVIQSPVHSDAIGAVWPLPRARLVPGNAPHQLNVALTGRRTSYVLDLDGAKVVGEKRPIADARKTMFTQWYGEKKAAQLLAQSAQVS